LIGQQMFMKVFTIESDAMTQASLREVLEYYS